ncbi:MAG: hypothetical protein KAT17_03095 [Candidatus Aminicenantes bacterium]|nr:hypothetical protein [Candidatus Aminicenantes bacterium]
MKQKSILLALLLFTLFGSFTSLNGEIKFFGMVQTWLSYSAMEDETPMGFTLRRVRFKPFGSLSKSLTWALQFGWDKQVAMIQDAYLEWKSSEKFRIRVGEYTVPGTISSSLTSSAELDMLERPEITLKWAKLNELSQYRSVGLQFHGQLFDNKIYYAVMFANNSTFGLFTPNVGDLEYDATPGITLWTRLEAKLSNGLRFGGFYGRNQLTKTETSKSSYGIHLFYVQQPINFKIEYIAGRKDDETEIIRYEGMYALFGYRIKKFEFLIQYDNYKPNRDLGDEEEVLKYDNITLGCNFFVSNKIKLQANYIFRNEEFVTTNTSDIKNNIFYINFQYSF